MSIQIQIIKRRGRPPMPNMNRDKTSGRSRGEAVESIIATALQPRLKSGIAYEESVVRDKRTNQIVGINPLTGYALGRMKMLGKDDVCGISDDQFLAGERYARVVDAFRIIMGVPSPNAKAANFLGVGGASLKADMDPDYVERIKLEYHACTAALYGADRENNQGNQISKITNTVCMNRIDYAEIIDDRVVAGNVRAGLNAVSRAQRKCK